MVATLLARVGDSRVEAEVRRALKYSKVCAQHAEPGLLQMTAILPVLRQWLESKRRFSGLQRACDGHLAFV